VKGRTGSTRIYEVIDAAPGDARASGVAAFEEALGHHLDRRFDLAVAGFSAIVRADPQDRAAALYLHRSALLIANPPAADWDGVERLETK
jgi:adenylate cyclase